MNTNFLNATGPAEIAKSVFENFLRAILAKISPTSDGQILYSLKGIPLLSRGNRRTLSFGVT
jgi:hypothetical protein